MSGTSSTSSTSSTSDITGMNGIKGTAELLARVEAAQQQGEQALAGAPTTADLKAAEAELLGRKSALAQLNTSLRDLTPEDRKLVGQAVNDARAKLISALANKKADLDAVDRARALQADRLDLTESLRTTSPSGVIQDRGHLHLVTQTRDELEDTFVAMGFSVAEGPEAETDWYNFEALNMPPAHPARGMWDTLYLKLGAPETVLLRTHTSPVQIHLMENQKPPIYAVMPGRCYRRDTPDARHLPVFHQIEGLVVDRGITFGDLAGTIEALTEAFFGPGMHSRLRPSYFPFTEPSAEFEVTCPICGGDGCRTCSGSGWIELGGCGMVDPEVFAAVGIDPEEYSGFAFGFGIDRLAQVRHGIEDMRILLDNDLRFISQF
ncbi:MAG: phenylalanyl-tRNA synthetase alpha chain [Acidimicrobiaceae bacterium]|nr:phenylalanyl-tRNA synthetase alpha chain [Acidimicrobiaceae bacterium]